MKVQQHDGSVIEMDKKAPESLEVLNHSTSHLLAQAVSELYPDALFGFGPAIENGFYYDIDFSTPIVEDDLAKIEKKMHELSSKDEKIVRKELTKEEAVKLQIYVDILEKIKKKPINNTEAEKASDEDLLHIVQFNANK